MDFQHIDNIFSEILTKIVSDCPVKPIFYAWITGTITFVSTVIMLKAMTRGWMNMKNHYRITKYADCMVAGP